MRDYPAYRKMAIRYWERRRLFFNLALVLPAAVGYVFTAGMSAYDERTRILGTGAVILLFLVSAIGANVCYTFSYAVEFIFGSDDQLSRWFRYGRHVTFFSGTLFAMILALMGGRNIGLMEYYYK